MPDSPQSALQRKLTDINRLAEERDALRRAERTGYPYIDIRKIPISTEAIKLIPELDARDAKASAIEIKLREVAVAALDPQSPGTQKIIQDLEARKYAVKLFVVSLSGLNEAWHFYKFVSATTKDITGKVEIEKQRFEGLLQKLTTFKMVNDELSAVDFNKLSTTNLFEIILAGALSNRASDIHFEAEEKSARVRYRLDGLLHDIYNALPAHSYNSLLSRIKLLSGLKINVYGEAQDGRFTIDLPTKEVEMRVSIVPSEFGETIVMRVLDPDSIHVKLEELGMRPDIFNLAKKELSKPNGLILNTGPTGSGKTTTLYAFLESILSTELKIITIEDPIEYRVAGIEQTQVHADAGYTFASGLRALMRQDPDVILVGEIRDHETADIALQASLTGHLVLSTLHANDAVASIPRLVNLNIPPETIGPSLTLIIAQRLVRIFCKSCRKEAAMDDALKAHIEKMLSNLPPQVDRTPYKNYKLYEPVGCNDCNGLGYKGRRAIFEFLEVTPEMQELILKETSEMAIRNIARKQGWMPFQEDGILKALTGFTSLKEVEDITGPIEWDRLSR
ncbi:MAG: ATPase, T2SS/T4P/T4SS family [Candidatus Liptonbacteria bacterium]